MESAPEDIRRICGGAGLFYLNQLFSAGDVTDATVT